ncbi:MAG: hypothetical protein ACQETB_12730 [Halobacteriota archaeon]
MPTAQYHVVCRNCRFETLADSELQADRLVTKHRRTTGHATVFDRVT